MIAISEDNYKSIEDIEDKSKQYKLGTIDPLRFKAFRVSMGVYEQREKETYMVRTRIPGGVITLEQFKRISELGKKYSHGKIRFTSRQDIQFQSVQLEDVYPIMKALIEVGIITKGTGGNTVRNVACSPLSGVSLDDVFDVTPYVKAATDYLIKDPTTMNLPRKYKIAFSNSIEDTANATISDLGFIAKILNNKKGFELYGGGGFGGSPSVSLKLRDFIETKDILYYIQAMKNLFEKEGDRTNKNKARIRFIVKRLGSEKFIRLFDEEVKKLKSSINLDIDEVDENEFILNTSSDIVKEAAVSEKLKDILFPQKQSGYYSVYIHPQSGHLVTDNLDAVLDFIKNLNYETSFRVTNTQGFFIRDLKENDAEKLIDIIKSFTSVYNIDNSLTCVGASTCQLGLCLSQNLLTAIKEEFKNASQEIKSSLPRLYISGCPNSCAQHEKGQIGLHGRAKRTESGLIPMYSVSLGGKVGSECAKIGDTFGDIPAKKIPAFLLELSKLKLDSNYDDFYEFLSNKSSDIKELMEKYTHIEKFIDESDIFFDFGACERFSLKNRGAGECSSGVMDVIKLDLSNAKSSFAKYKDSKDDKDLYSSAVSSARTLLVLRGIDTNKPREIFKEFEKAFIATGYVRSSTKALFESLIDYKLGDLENISDKYSEIDYLYKKVEAMYESLNGKLEITLAKEEPEVTASDEKNKPEEKKDYEILDFRGVKCPMNFVKAKLELSKIKSGQKKGFYIDDGDPIKNVPESIKKEGHNIVSIDRNYDGYNLLIIEKK